MANENENENRSEPFARGDIVIPKRKHGKIYRFLDNFWYHHKWATIISLFLVVVIVVCTVQMCQKEEEKTDISVVCAGPYGFLTNEEGLKQLQNILAYHLPNDYNGDGEKRVGVLNYSVYYEEHLAGMSADDAQITRMAAQDEYRTFYQHLATGEFSVAFLTPSLFEELAAQDECLIDLTVAFDARPENGVYHTLPDGSTVCYGVRLGDSALYRNNVAMQILPEDTVLCLIGAVFFGNDKEYERSVEYFKALLAQN